MSERWSWQLLIQRCLLLERVQTGFSVGALNRVSYQLHSYHASFKCDWVNKRASTLLMRRLFQRGRPSWFIHSFISLCPCPGPWTFVPTVADVLLAQAFIPLSQKHDHSLLKACSSGKLELRLSKVCSLLETRILESNSFTCCFSTVCTYGHTEKISMSLPLEWNAVAYSKCACTSYVSYLWWIHLTDQFYNIKGLALSQN